MTMSYIGEIKLIRLDLVWLVLRFLLQKKKHEKLYGVLLLLLAEEWAAVVSLVSMLPMYTYFMHIKRLLSRIGDFFLCLFFSYTSC